MSKQTNTLLLFVVVVLVVVLEDELVVAIGRQTGRQITGPTVMLVDEIEEFLCFHPANGSTERMKISEVVRVGTGMARSPAPGGTIRL